MMNGRFMLFVYPVGSQYDEGARWVDSTEDAVVFTQYPSEHVSLNKNTTYYINSKHSTSTKNTDMKRIMSTQDNRTPQTTAAIYAQEQAANVPGTYTGYYEAPIPSNVIYAKQAGVEDWNRYRWGDKTAPFQRAEQDTVKVPNGKIASLRFETDGDTTRSFAFFAQVGGLSYVKFKMKMWISRTPGGPPIAQNIRKNIRDKNATPVFIEGNLSTGLIMKCSQFDWNARFGTSHWVAALQLNTVYYVNYERVAGNQPSEPFMHGRWFIKYMNTSGANQWIEGKPTATPGQTYPVPEPESVSPNYDNLSYTKPITRAQWESDADVVSEVTYVDKAGILVTEFTASGLPGWGKSFKHEYVSSSYNGRDENMRYRAWITSKPGGPAITQCLNRRQNSGDVINVRMADLEGGNECRVFPGKTYYLCVQTVGSTSGGGAKTVTRTMSTLNNTNVLQDAERDVVLASDPVLVRDDILTRAVMTREMFTIERELVDVISNGVTRKQYVTSGTTVITTLPTNPAVYVDYRFRDATGTPKDLSITLPENKKTIAIGFETDNDRDREGIFRVETLGLTWKTWISLTPGGPPLANSTYHEGSSVLTTTFVTDQYIYQQAIDNEDYAGFDPSRGLIDANQVIAVPSLSEVVIIPVNSKLYFNIEEDSGRESTFTFSLQQTRGTWGLDPSVTYTDEVSEPSGLQLGSTSYPVTELYAVPDFFPLREDSADSELIEIPQGRTLAMSFRAPNTPLYAGKFQFLVPPAFPGAFAFVWFSLTPGGPPLDTPNSVAGPFCENYFLGFTTFQRRDEDGKLSGSFAFLQPNTEYYINLAHGHPGTKLLQPEQATSTMGRRLFHINFPLTLLDADDNPINAR